MSQERSAGQLALVIKSIEHTEVGADVGDASIQDVSGVYDII